MEQPTKTKNTMSKRVIAIIITAIAVIAIAAGVALAVHRHHATSQLTEAKTACAQAADRLRVAQNNYNALINGDEYKSAVKITAKQVEDSKVVTTLAKDSEDETPKMVACNVDDKTALERNTGLIDKNTTWYETHTKTIDADVKNVVKARDTKTLKDTQAALAKKITDAKKLYDASNGKVKDNKTRDALKKQLDAAGKLKDGKDVKKIKDAQTALDKAMKTVNDSVKAKQDADKKAAEEQARKEAEAQAAAQANAQAQQYVAPQQSYTPTYTAPQYTAPAAPQYTAPQQTTPQYTAPQQTAPKPAAPAAPSTGGNSGGGPISGGHGCGSLCTSTTDTYDR
ncbi:hypothetical protein LF916_09110 [Bifidobacterium pseudolongum]|uniref:hypothetical protein n=1 Tax=Bifidobacterium pseudolongum TaxID=1694 RepID=UPI001F10E0A4|nr:hypothetical protein [Bifidobacterium pseudolongum]MCH4861001.1 hypothetical protein [Bifidobacterium pseudolongum]MCH4862793.1 hypothetical protein [Bifidobacterium pseudolongum]